MSTLVATATFNVNMILCTETCSLHGNGDVSGDELLMSGSTKLPQADLITGPEAQISVQPILSAT